MRTNVIRLTQRSFSALGVPGLALGIALSSSACIKATLITVNSQHSALVSIDLSPSSLKTIAGDADTFTPSGGTPAYSFQDGGTGYINSTTGVYSAPLGTAAGTTDTVRVFDSLGFNSSRSSVTIRAFETKDQFNLAEVGVRSYGKGIAVDSAGALYAVGIAGETSNDPPIYWVVRKSTDAGVTWATIDTYQLPGTFTIGSATLPSYGSAQATAIAIDADDKIYVAGYSGAKWLVRKSTDGGANWATVENFEYVTNKSVLPGGIAFDSSKNVYVAGYAMDASNYSHWIVRKSVNAGTSWSTVDDYQSAASAAALAYGIAIDSNDNIFVVGYGKIGAAWPWIVRKSANGGTSWTNVDSYQLSGAGGLAFGIAIDSSDNIFVGGYSKDGSSNNHWIVRKAASGGTAWSTVDNYQPVATLFDIRVRALAIDSSDNVYAVGTVKDASGVWTNWIVRKTTNGGTSWSVSDAYAHSATNMTIEANGIAIDGSNRVYVIGEAYDSATSKYDWVVRKTSNGGTNWAVVDDYNQLRKPFARAHAIKEDTSGVLYSAGFGNDQNTSRWVVRKSTDGAASWTTVDTYGVGAANAYIAYDLATSGSGTIYVVGYLTASSVKSWIVRKSTDAGATWNDVDTYNMDSSEDSIAYSISIDGNGHIYVAGYGKDSSAQYHWQVRKSTNGGTSWTTVDSYQYAASYSVANDIAIDSTGTIYAVGESYDGSSKKHWIVRKSTNGGTSWSTVDDYSYAAGYHSFAQSIAIDKENRVYVGGSRTDAATTEGWTIRKSSNGGTSWSVIANSTAVIQALATDTSGNVYAIGKSSLDATTYTYDWLTQKSRDQGVTWKTIDRVSNTVGRAITPCLTDRLCSVGTTPLEPVSTSLFYPRDQWTTRILSQ